MNTVKEAWEMECPECKDDTTINIVISVWARLTPDGTDLDIPEDTDHDWTNQSPATCGCGFNGKVKDFKRIK